MFNFKQYDWKRLNISLIIAVIILCIISAFTIKLGVSNAFFKKQIFGLVLGLILLAVFTLLDYHFLCRFVAIYYLAIIGLLLLVRYSPLGSNQNTKAYRWIDLKVIAIQPSDFAKLALILTLAVILTSLKEKMDKFYVVLLTALITMIPTALIYIQPNLSTSLIMIFIFVIMIFAAGLSYKIIIAIFSVAIPTGGALLWYILQPGEKILIKPYMVERIVGFFNPEKVEKGIGWQQTYSESAIASGKVYGKLILDGPSSVRIYNRVDVNESDFIFSIIGEEYGFIGCCVLLSILAFIIVKCLFAARKSADRLGMLIAIGISSMLMCQVFGNVGVATFLLPNTGLPLPFLSYGLSSLMSNMIAIGLILNIGIQRKTRR